VQDEIEKLGQKVHGGIIPARNDGLLRGARFRGWCFLQSPP
jgi:hypothetical protein